MEDTGKMVQLGWSAGQRNKNKCHWVKNITTRCISQDAEAELNKKASSLFALAWQIMKQRLPAEVIDDFNNFVEDLGINRMDANGQMSQFHPEGAQVQQSRPKNSKATGKRMETKFWVESSTIQFEFTGAELAPPSGVIGQNYSR